MEVAHAVAATAGDTEVNFRQYILNNDAKQLVFNLPLMSIDRGCFVVRSIMFYV